MCSPIALRRSVMTSTAKRKHEGNMQSNNNSNILNYINFHTSSTPCYWWSRWKPPTPTATASGWPLASSAGAGSHQRSCGSLQACLCSFAQAAHEQPVFAAQHAGECLEQHSAQHASHITCRRMRPASSIALALSMSRSSLWFV